MADAPKDTTPVGRPAAERSTLPQMRVEEEHDMDLALRLDEKTLDPTRHYRFEKDSQVILARRRAQGYRVEKGGEKTGPRTMVDVDSAADGTIRVGDTILISCPKETHDAREQQRLARAEKRTQRPPEVEKLHQEGRKHGVPVVNHTEW